MEHHMVRGWCFSGPKLFLSPCWGCWAT